MKNRTLLLLGLTLVLAACGGSGGDDSSPSAAAPMMSSMPSPGSSVAPEGATTVELTMKEFSFTPSDVAVKAGEPVHFVFTNEGAVEHEAVIGDADFQAEHEEEMASGGDMSMNSDEPEVTVPAGATATLDYVFDDPGTYFIGCHVAGHWAAGMKATVTVT